LRLSYPEIANKDKDEIANENEDEKVKKDEEDKQLKRIKRFDITKRLVQSSKFEIKTFSSFYQFFNIKP
jgi:hypothetical protein